VAGVPLMRWLVINTEAFSPKGLKQQKDVTFDDLPWVVRALLAAFAKVFIVLDESSKIKQSTPMMEKMKSSRCRMIKQLAKTNSERCIMTGTLMSKSPLNVIDQYNFLKEKYFPESMYDFAEHYCVMETLHTARGRRIIISQKSYDTIRKRLRNTVAMYGVKQLPWTMESIQKQYGVSLGNQDWIMRHKRYTPFIHQKELIKRIEKDTMFVERKDVFDISFDKFVTDPIMRPVQISEKAKKIASELIDLGFTDSMVLGKAPALELMIRLQDICNGFEPVKDEEGNITYKPFTDNPKIDALMELLEEIDVEKNQVVVWSSRKVLLKTCMAEFQKAGYEAVVYDGDTKDTEKAAAEKDFLSGKARIFLANQASGGYGLNCLGKCSYAIYMCIDGSVEQYHQSQHRILRGELTAPKFAYHIYAEGSVEERQMRLLKVGQELISSSNTREVFEFV
jgi:hypothetical protein